MRQAAVVIELIEHIYNLLGSTDGERGDEQLTFAINAGVFDHAEQLLFRDELFIVDTVSIGRFADEVIALREELRRRQDMTMQTTYVTGVC